MRIRLTLQLCKTACLLLLLLPLLFTSCEDPEHSDSPVCEDSEDSGNSENNGDSGNSYYRGDYRECCYYPFVDRIEVSAGKGYCDVTIYGLLSDGFHISDVQITIFQWDIILVPIATAGLKGADAFNPFKKTVHIEDLDRRHYTISIIGWRERERILITETVKVE
ncbi:hypothetical protein H8E77_40360 [bacterium]|nr:hypothetical protein [bacterium]